ncbi:MAG: DUF72 domain-containing protein [Candidatus Bathyarchaeota archaeon]
MLHEDETPAPGATVLVGTGGWDYLDAEGDRLKAYSKLFNFVEVNTTFYHVPRLSAVRSWRRRVPRGFTFSVKCHSRATHELGLRPQEETYRTLDRMRQVLRLLRTDMLVLQTPPSLHVDEAKVREAEAVLKSSAAGGAQVFWETRSPLSREKTRETRQAMLRAGFTPVVDLTLEEPVQGSGVTYSRLFGVTRFSDSLLDSVGAKVWSEGSEVAVLTFHGSAMYRDAARFKELRR